MTGRPQEIPEQTIGASYGDALLAGIGTGLLQADTDWARIASVVEPRPEAQEAYEQLFTVFEELYPATKPQVHALASMQEAAHT